jgi:outer membrane protein assembly factor BamD (BamD/ComL family)
MTPNSTLRTVLPMILLASACGTAIFLTACASAIPAPSPGLTPAEFFQGAQDAADKGEYKLAIEYYELFQKQYPEDRNHQAWAAYEMAFLYHRMGDNKKAVALFDDLLALYAKEEHLPDGPRILAEKVKSEIEAKTPSHS